MKRIVNKYTSRLRKGDSGFTLIELLIVLGIIAALAAAIIPNLGAFTGSGEKGGKEVENTNVQAAFDLFMTDNKVGALSAAPTQSNQLWTAQPTAPNVTKALDDYLRSTRTVYFYCWNTGGKITKQLVASAGGDC